MKELRYGIDKEPVLVYHHIVLGLAFIKGCPFLKEEDYTTSKTMTEKWFNQIVDWLCANYPQEFILQTASSNAE